jgi:hypothetical protein
VPHRTIVSICRELQTLEAYSRHLHTFLLSETIAPSLSIHCFQKVFEFGPRCTSEGATRSHQRQGSNGHFRSLGWPLGERAWTELRTAGPQREAARSDWLREASKPHAFFRYQALAPLSCRLVAQPVASSFFATFGSLHASRASWREIVRLAHICPRRGAGPASDGVLLLSTPAAGLTRTKRNNQLHQPFRIFSHGRLVCCGAHPGCRYPPNLT